MTTCHTCRPHEHSPACLSSTGRLFYGMTMEVVCGLERGVVVLCDKHSAMEAEIRRLREFAAELGELVHAAHFKNERVRAARLVALGQLRNVLKPEQPQQVEHAPDES